MPKYLFVLVVVALWSCSSDEVGHDAINNERNFGMGFTSWPYAPTVESVNDTYAFIQTKGDIYAEHIDDRIPWIAWKEGSGLPLSFVQSIDAKAAKRQNPMDLVLSVSILNTERDDLKEDWDGNTLDYNRLNDHWIEDAYVKHVEYLVERLNPQYLIFGIEVNELLLRSPGKWEDFRQLMAMVKERLKSKFPDLPMSQSITLHNFYQPDVSNPSEYINEVSTYMNENDFVAVSFYPFFKNLNTSIDFQDAFDFLHARTSLPIAIVETSHLAEDLSIPNLSLNIPGNPIGQKDYLQVLLDNAAENDYLFVIWWCHRDYDLLWNTFPDELKDIGKIWRDTGLLNEFGQERPAFELWMTSLNNK